MGKSAEREEAYECEEERGEEEYDEEFEEGGVDYEEYEPEPVIKRVDYDSLKERTERMREKGATELVSANVEVDEETIRRIGVDGFNGRAAYIAAEALKEAGYRDFIVQVHLQNEARKTHVQVQASPDAAKEMAELAAEAIERWIDLTEELTETDTEIYDLKEKETGTDINIKEALEYAESILSGAEIEADEYAEIDADALITEVYEALQEYGEEHGQ